MCNVGLLHKKSMCVQWTYLCNFYKLSFDSSRKQGQWSQPDCRPAVLQAQSQLGPVVVLELEAFYCLLEAIIRLTRKLYMQEPHEKHSFKRHDNVIQLTVHMSHSCVLPDLKM